MAELLSREELGGCSSEGGVLNAALSWAGAQGENGSVALPDLLQLERLPRVSGANKQS